MQAAAAIATAHIAESDPMFFINILGLAGWVIQMFMQLRMVSLVPGTRQRFIAATWRRVGSWTMIITAVIEGLDDLAVRQPVYAGLDFLFAGIWFILERRFHKDDDDWFNGRWTKIKNAIKNALRNSGRVEAPA